MNTHRPALGMKTRTKIQDYLDECDRYWFDRYPDETTRLRFHFKDERIEGDDVPTRQVVVTIERDRLVRRFLRDGGEG